MDNESSSPQIQFPNVPDDFCPTGNWQEVLQQFIDIVLSNGTINVPGLGDVTPAQIQTINAELASQQNQINALDTQLDAIDTQVTTLNTQVSTLNTQVTTLDTRVDALELIPVVTIRTSTVAVPAGNSTQVVNFSALPGANYGVSIIPVGTSTSRANMGSYVLLAGQTTTQFSIAVEDNPATVTSLRWTAIHTA
jgi:hypothetical protein